MRYVALGVLAGTGLAIRFALNNPAAYLPLLLALGIACFLASNGRALRLFTGAAIIGIFVAGAQLMCMQNLWSVLSAVSGNKVSAVVRIDGRSGTTSAGERLKVTFLSLNGRSSGWLWPVHGRLSSFGGPVAKPGEVWLVRAKLHASLPPDKKGSPSGMNWDIANRIWLKGYVRQYVARVEPCDSWICTGREALGQQLSLRMSAESAALAIGVVSGDSGSLPREWSGAMRKAGLGHLLAVSGLHVGAVVSVAWLLVLPLTRVTGLDRRWPRQPFVLGLAVGLAWSYVAFAGWAVSAERAALMLTVGFLAALGRRVVDVLDVWLFSLAIVVLLDPVAIGSPSLWLSFVAVVLIIFALKRSRGRRLWSRWLLVQVYLFFGMAPLTLYLFDWFALPSLAMNLLFTPLFALLFFPVLLLSLVADVGTGMTLFWSLLDQGLQIMVRTAVQVQDLALPVGLPWSVAALLGLCVVTWISPRPLGSKRFSITMGGVILAVWLGSPWLRPWGAKLSLLDTGQSLATVIETGGHALVYDVGRHGGGVVRWLDRRPLLSRNLIISHSDSDHSGGLQRDYPWSRFQRLYSGQTAVLQRTYPWSWRRCRQGDGFIMGRVSVRILWPAEGVQAGSDNDQSCVVQLEIGDQRVLLTGDITQTVERQLLLAGVLEPVTILLVPHHGSRHSSSLPFLERLRPSYALIAAAQSNPWGFPRREVLDRLAKVHSSVLWTGIDGALVCEWDRDLEFRGCGPQVVR